MKLIVSTITSALLLIPQASVAITKASSVEIIHQVRNGPTANDIPISTTTKNANCKGPAVICKNYIQFGFISETVAKAKIELPLLAAATAHKPSLTLWFQDFTEKLNVKQIKASSKNGQLPIVSWEPQKLKDKIPDNYPLNDIASGKFDKYLISSAKLAKWARVPFVIRFAHEMNGYWYPWGQPKPGDPRSLATRTNTPTQYINAYRHVHDIFQSVGAKNVIWMWSPNLIDATPTISLKSLYPGDSYVDVMGLSGYLRDPGQTYNTRFPKTLQQLSEINSTKPIIVAEMAVAKKLDRTLLIKELMRSLAHCPQIQGLLWLNKTTATHDFNILKDPVGLLVLKDELAQPRFNPTSGLRFSYVGIPAIAGSMT
ncbi:MAG: glycosyl hydrolase, partial [Chloroflexota bacterium]